jgi:hypothetical protein
MDDRPNPFIRADDLDGGPKARASDPDTSHAAANAFSTWRMGSHKVILWEAYIEVVEGTDYEVACAAGIPLDTEYATRCSELRNAGLIEDTGKRRPGGKSAERMVCRITQYGREQFVAHFGEV